MGLRVVTIGDGAMATVCSVVLARAGHQVVMFGRRAEQTAAFQAARRNGRYLPQLGFPEYLEVTSDGSCGRAAELIINAVPTQFIRPVCTLLAAQLPAGVPVVSVSKGIENQTLQRPSEVLREVLGPRPVAAFSGPSIAGELAAGLPATMVVASPDDALNRHVQALFTTPFLRVYRNDDLPGVELAGALKNVIAVAAGILDGMGAGNNAKAALLTRGLVEISRLGLALGAHAETFSGLAGLGDLVTTCVSPGGRNRSFGEAVGRGAQPAMVLAGMVGVVEGVATTRSVVSLAGKMRVEMPISTSLYAVLFEGKSPREGIAELMSRQPKPEAPDA
jgi:glycerol-3-phosphate dehydrogenase (NAD(P)+)